MIKDVKILLKKNDLPGDWSVFTEVRNHLDPHFGWLYFLIKMAINDDLDAEEVITIYEDLKKHNVSLSDVKKMNYEKIMNFLDQFERNELDIGETIVSYKDLDIIRVKNIRQLNRISSPLWCINSTKYWNKYVKEDGRQYICITGKKGLSYNQARDFNLASYKIKNPYTRIGITLGCPAITSFDDNNNDVLKDKIVHQLIYDTIIPFDLDYIKENNLRFEWYHWKQVGFDNIPNYKVVDEDDDFIMLAKENVGVFCWIKKLFIPGAYNSLWLIKLEDGNWQFANQSFNLLSSDQLNYFLTQHSTFKKYIKYIEREERVESKGFFGAIRDFFS